LGGGGFRVMDAGFRRGHACNRHDKMLFVVKLLREQVVTLPPLSLSLFFLSLSACLCLLLFSLSLSLSLFLSPPVSRRFRVTVKKPCPPPWSQTRPRRRLIVNPRNPTMPPETLDPTPHNPNPKHQMVMSIVDLKRELLKTSRLASNPKIPTPNHKPQTLNLNPKPQPSKVHCEPEPRGAEEVATAPLRVGDRKLGFDDRGGF